MIDEALRRVAAGMVQLMLEEIEAHDTDYDERYPLVLQAMAWASCAGLATGIAIDPEEPDWPAVYIELPTGQVSWHMPAHPTPYDGHSTPEKYARIRAYIEQDVFAHD